MSEVAGYYVTLYPRLACIPPWALHSIRGKDWLVKYDVASIAHYIELGLDMIYDICGDKD